MKQLLPTLVLITLLSCKNEEEERLKKLKRQNAVMEMKTEKLTESEKMMYARLRLQSAMLRAGEPKDSMNRKMKEWEIRDSLVLEKRYDTNIIYIR